MDIFGKIHKQIAEMGANESSALVLARVKEVNGATCSVLIDDLALSDVRLRAVINNQETGMVITPAVGSYVMITDLSNGNKRDWAVLMYSEIDKVEFNSGNNEGLIKIKDLTDKLNQLVDEVNALKDMFNNHTHSVSTTGTPTAQEGTAAPVVSKANAATKFNRSDYEDDHITH